MKKSLFFALLFCNLHALDFSNPAFSKFFSLSEQIGGRNVICHGHSYLEDYQKYIKDLEVDFGNSNLKELANYSQKLEYFSFWAHQSLDNFRLYKRFFAAENQFCLEFQNHFKSEEKCHIFTQRLGARAFGMASESLKMNEIYKAFLELDASEAIAYLSMQNLNYLEMNYILKLSLLEKKDQSVIEFLLENDTPLNLGYESAIFYAIDYPKALQMLLAAGAQVDYANSFGKTAIFYAIEGKNYESLEILIKNHADLNILEESDADKIYQSVPFYIQDCGYERISLSPLIAAVFTQDEKIVQILLKNGAKKELKNNQGKSALDYAKELKNQKIINLLKDE